MQKARITVKKKKKKRKLISHLISASVQNRTIREERDERDGLHSLQLFHQTHFTVRAVPFQVLSRSSFASRFGHTLPLEVRYCTGEKDTFDVRKMLQKINFLATLENHLFSGQGKNVHWSFFVISGFSWVFLLFFFSRFSCCAFERNFTRILQFHWYICFLHDIYTLSHTNWFFFFLHIVAHQKYFIATFNYNAYST